MTLVDFRALRLVLFLAGLGGFLGLELAFPFRRASVSKLWRWAANLLLSAANTGVLSVTVGAWSVAVSSYAASHRVGLLAKVAWPFWAKCLVTVAALDLLLYGLHILNHKLPWLWRFHQVHHSDLNLDVSTASRFHLIELLISGALRAAVVLALGAEPAGVTIFEMAFLAATQFHHSNVNVPAWVQAPLWAVIVPPAMHRVHHSVVVGEANSNYGTLTSLWDRLFGTLRRDVPQERVVIGLKEFRDPDRLGFLGLVLLPKRSCAERGRD